MNPPSEPLEPSGRTTTLILGGGFGGLATANTLRPLLPAGHNITLVDQAPRFHVGAGKTWLMLGQRKIEEISQARAALLEPGVDFHQTEILQLDLPGRSVLTAAGPLRWDFLVIALGADLRPDAVSGLATAHTFYTVEGAERLQATLAGFSAGNVVILIPKTPYKCPPAPYEAAMLLRHFFDERKLSQQVRLALYTVEGVPMATAGPEMGAYIKEELARRGIGFFPQKSVARVDDAARRVDFADGTSAAYDLLISVPPHEAPAVVRSAQLVNQAGWIPVDPRTMEIKSAPGDGRVFAIGDVTTVPLPGRFKPEVALALPKAGVMAAAQGEVVARRIAALVAGEPPTALFAGKGFCYLESGGGCAVRADGAFFELPHPAMSKRPPSPEQFADKLAWVARQLVPRR